MGQNVKCAVYPELQGWKAADPEVLRRHEEAFRKETSPKLEAMQRSKEEGAIKAAGYLLL